MGDQVAITWRIDFDWDGDGSYAYSESARVTALAIERGRANEFATFTAGKCVLTLEDHDRRFDSWYVESPLYGKVLPRRRVRVRAIETSLLSVELMTNGGFETRTGTDNDGVSDTFSGWTAVGVSDPTRRAESSTTKYAGTRALKLTGDTWTPYVYQSNIVVHPGESYLLSFYTRGDGSSAGSYAITDDVNETAIVSLTSTGVAATTYTLVSCVFTVPIDCTVITISLWAPLTSGTCYFDQVSLTEYGYWLFAGRIEDIEPSGAAGNRTVLITAYDGLRDLASMEVNAALQMNIRTDEAIVAILDEVGWPAADRDLDAGNDTLSYWWTPNDQKAKQMCDALAMSELGAFFIMANGNAIFINRRRFNTGWTGFAPISQAEIADIQIKQPWDTVANVIIVRCNPVQTSSEVVLWRLQDLNLYVAAGNSVEVWAEYKDATGNACVAENVISPVMTTDYTANSASGGGGTDLTASMGVVANIYSTWTKLTVTNSSATTGFYVTLLRVRGDGIAATTTMVRKDDAASQAIYGKRSLTMDLPWQQSISTALDLAETLKTSYANPLQAVDITFDNKLPNVFRYELGMRMVVIIAEYAISHTMRINSLTIWTGNTMQDVKATLGLTPADQNLYWLLGEVGLSELGTMTNLGY